jgi:hypothetical protein
VYAVDGQVCNGGFVQYYENTGGWPTAFAIEAFGEIGLGDFAEIIGVSLVSAMLYYPDLVADGVAVPMEHKILTPRSFEDLDSAYYAAQRNEPEWLEVAMIELVMTHRADF